MQSVHFLQECRGIYSMPWLSTCLAAFGVVSRYHGFKAQTGDTTSTECFAWSNSVWKPTERGSWGLPCTGRERSSGIFSTSLMLKLTHVFSVSGAIKGNQSLLTFFYEWICEKSCIEQLLSSRAGAQNLTNILKCCHLRQHWLWERNNEESERSVSRGVLDLCCLFLTEASRSRLHQFLPK